jgi:hypothetical protein
LRTRRHRRRASGAGGVLAVFTVAHRRTPACLAALVACSDSTSPTSIAGTYNLTSINGSGLPFILQASGPKIEILSDQIVANAGGTFSESGNYRVTNGTAVTTQIITDAGTYTVSGTAVTFLFSSDGSTGTGTLSGNTFTIAGNGFSSVYTK